MHGETQRQRRVFGRIAAIVIGVFVAGLLALQNGIGEPSKNDMPVFDAPTDVAELQQCMDGKDGARILVIGDDNLAARAGALEGMATMMEPRNMAQGRLDGQGVQAFFGAFSVEYVLLADPARSPAMPESVPLSRVQNCPLMLYAIAR